MKVTHDVINETLVRLLRELLLDYGHRFTSGNNTVFFVVWGVSSVELANKYKSVRLNKLSDIPRIYTQSDRQRWKADDVGTTLPWPRSSSCVSDSCKEMPRSNYGGAVSMTGQCWGYADTYTDSWIRGESVIKLLYPVWNYAARDTMPLFYRGGFALVRGIANTDTHTHI